MMPAANRRRTPAVLLLLLIVAAGELRLADAAEPPRAPTSTRAADAQPVHEERIIKLPHGEGRIGHGVRDSGLHREVGPCTDLGGKNVAFDIEAPSFPLSYSDQLQMPGFISIGVSNNPNDGFEIYNSITADGVFIVRYTTLPLSQSYLTTNTLTSSAFVGLRLANIVSSNSTLQSVQLVGDTITVQYATGWNNTSPTTNFVLDLTFQLLPFCCTDAGTLDSCCTNATTIAPAGTICRARGHPCDAIERCDGIQPSCTNDTSEPDGTICAWFEPRHNRWVVNHMGEEASPAGRRDVNEQEALDQLAATGRGTHYRHKRCLGRCRLGTCLIPHKTRECCRSHYAASAEEYAAAQQDNSAAAFAYTEGGRWHCWD